MILYDYFRSSACFRVRIALNLKSLNYEKVPIHLLNHGGEQFSAAYQKVNSQSLVPTLKDGDKILTQSLAIIEYLDETYPTPALLPTDAYHKALVRSFALMIAADIHPLNNLRVLTYLTNELNITEEKKTAWYQHWMQKGLAASEKQLVNQGKSNDFCFGNEPSLADICLVPQLYNAKRFSCDLTAYPTLLKIDKHCEEHPAFKNAQPTEAS